MQDRDTITSMVPLKLSLKNFLSYGQTTQYIDFEAYNLICLSGKNGHGKSALLDALTWALWGQARKNSNSTRSDESLVRLGQTHMMVCLEFLCNNNVYRVRRELTIASHKVQTSLDFGIVDPATKQIRGLTDKTIRATQEKIIHAIGLDYESFVNSVFLRQGASNEFSKKSPKERKEILCSILGITQFEAIKKRAIEKTRTIATQKETLIPIYQRIASELLQKEPLLQQLSSAKEQEQAILHHQKILQDDLEKNDAQLRMILNNVLLLEQAQELNNNIHQRINMIHHDLQAAHKEFRTIISTAQNLKKAPVYTYEHLQKKLEEITHQEHDFFKTQQDIMRAKELLQNRIVFIQKRQTDALHELEIHHKQTQYHTQLLETQQTELNQKISSIKHDIQKKIGTLSAEKTIQKYEKYRELYQKYVTLKNNSVLKIEDYHYNIKKLTSHSVAHCPTCNQELIAEKRNQLCAEQYTQLRHAQHKLNRFNSILPPLKACVISLHASVDSIKETTLLERQCNELIEQEKKIARELEHKHKELQEIQTKSTTIKDFHATELELDHDYGILKKTAAQHAEKMSLFPADIAEQKQKILDLLAVSTRNYHAHSESTLLVRAQIKKTIHAFIAQIRSLKKEKAAIQEKIDSFKKNVLELENTENMLKKIRSDMHQNTEILNTLLGQIGSYKEQLSRLELQEKEYARLHTTLAEYTHTQTVYHTIGQAVGKDGIQALLIEKALPEIEHEANALLEKLTDNQAHLSIESLRDLKSGKTKETLDIHISDATGIRAYEMFSGGEAFRIDFALRIALSKLLARKSGTSLQTLIIDEGFGSQDEEGLNHIMDALYKIQDDFAKIIIVSHLPYMKDQFPVHFVIHKSAQGSSIKVVEQG